MTAEKGRIFISYRRADSAAYAGRIYDRLSAHFGKDVIFMDVDNIEAGESFASKLKEAVESCDAFIVLIGKQWLDIQAPDGRRRLDDSQDFVRMEVSMALKRKNTIPIIPILVDGGNMPRVEELPPVLKPLSYQHGILVQHLSFHRDVTHLVKQLEKTLKKQKKANALFQKRKKITPNRLSSNQPSPRYTLPSSSRKKKASLKLNNIFIRFILSLQKAYLLIFFIPILLITLAIKLLTPTLTYSIPTSLPIISPLNTVRITELAQKKLFGSYGIYAVDFSADGKKVLAGTGDSSVYLWDTFTGDIIYTLKDHTDIAWSVDFSPNGELFASGSQDNTIHLWGNSGELRQTLNGHSGSISSIVFSPDGLNLASGSSDKTIRMWNTHDGSLTKILSEHSSAVTDIAFSPDSNLLASGGTDGVIHLWEVSTGKVLMTLEHTGTTISSVGFSPKEDVLASGNSDGTIRLWDSTNGEPIKTLDGHQGRITSIDFSPDGEMLISSSSILGNGTLQLWRVSDGSLLQTLEINSSGIYDVVFSPNGSLIACGSADGTVRIWGISPQN